MENQAHILTLVKKLHMLPVILKAKKLLERFTKTNQKEFKIGKVIKRKGDKLYIKWKRYKNSLNSWIENH